MSRFKEDMRKMYHLIGRKIVKEFLKLEFIFIPFVVFLSTVTGTFSTTEKITLLAIPNLAFLIAYGILYLTTYRPIFTKSKNEEQIDKKYKGLFDSFNKSY